MLNKVTIMGRLTREPELRYTSGNVPVCTITIACDRDFVPQGGQREADFFDIVCWRHTGEFVSKYFGKGQMIACEGRLVTRKWRDKYEQSRVSFEIVADNVYFAGDRREAAPTGTQVLDRVTGVKEAFGHDGTPYLALNKPQAGWPEYNEPELPQSDFAALEDDDDVPF